MATNFSTIGRTLPGLQYMMSRMSSMCSSGLAVASAVAGADFSLRNLGRGRER